MVESKSESIGGDQDFAMFPVRAMPCRVDDGDIGVLLDRSCP
jgi:hypothetical protein